MFNEYYGSINFCINYYFKNVPMYKQYTLYIYYIPIADEQIE